MHEDVKRFSVKFIETTGRWADIEVFNEDDAWEFMKDLLVDYVKTGRRLTDGQITVLRNLGAAMSMKPGSHLRIYVPALERSFGPTPMSDEDLNLLARYLYDQVNGGGDFEPHKKAPVTLQSGLPGERPGVPSKRRIF